MTRGHGSDSQLMYRVGVGLSLLVLVGSTMGQVTASNEWPGFQNGPRRTGFQDGGSLDALDIIWQIQLEGQVKASPVVADGMVFTATDRGNVYGSDVRNGRTLWGPVKLNQPVFGTPTHENNRLYVATSKVDGSAGRIYVLDSATGAEIMNVSLTSGSYGGVAIHDGKLFVGQDDGILVAYDTESMTKLWSFTSFVKIDKSAVPESGFGRTDCCAESDIKAKPIKSVPLVYNDLVIFGSFNHQLFAVDSGGNPGSETTKMVWVENLLDIVFSSAGIGRATPAGADLVVAGSYSGRVVAFDASPAPSAANCPNNPDRYHHPVGNVCSKSIYWVHETGSRIFASPAIAGHRAYVGDEAGVFRALSLGNGQAAWSYATHGTIRSSAAVMGDMIVVGNYDGSLYLFKEDEKGNLIHGYPKTVALSDKIHSSPAIAGGKVFVATMDGVLYALAAPGTAVPPGGPLILGEPDYHLKDLVLTPRKAVAGSPLEVNVALHNSGGSSGTPVSLRLYNGKTLINETSVEVAGGLATSHSFVWTPDRGDLFLRIVVNEDADGVESNISNNVLEQHHVVEAGAPPPASGTKSQPTGGETASDEDEKAPAPGMMILVAFVGALLAVMRRRP